MQPRLPQIPLLIAAVLVLCLAAGSASAESEKSAAPPTPPTAKTKEVMNRALGFVASDAVAWRKKFGCATCHHGAMTVWALTEARQQGYPIDEALLSEFTRWTREQFLHRVAEPKDPMPGWNTVSIAGMYFGVMSLNLPVLSREEVEQLSLHLATRQKSDGAWQMPPPANGQPPTWESRETIAMLGALAWENTAPSDPNESATVQAALEKLVAWQRDAHLPDTTQAAALHLMLDLRQAAPAGQIQSDVTSLLSRQNADGGWSQIKDIPSDAYATGQSLWALSFAGLAKDRPEITRAVSFLVSTQRPDGSWPMTPRDHEGAKPNPKRFAVPIIYFGSAWGTIGLLRSVPATSMLDLALRQQRARDAIHALSGKCVEDDKRPGKPVTGVTVVFEVNDTELSMLVTHLTVFPELETLNLDTERLTDAGLSALKDLPQLRNLTIKNAKITDTGLAQLATLTHLENLNLKGTDITDAGIQTFHRSSHAKVEH
jgi:hypothetical protein